MYFLKSFFSNKEKRIPFYIILLHFFFSGFLAPALSGIVTIIFLKHLIYVLGYLVKCLILLLGSHWMCRNILCDSLLCQLIFQNLFKSPLVTSYRYIIEIVVHFPFFLYLAFFIFFVFLKLFLTWLYAISNMILLFLIKTIFIVFQYIWVHFW